MSTVKHLANADGNLSIYDKPVWFGEFLPSFFQCMKK